MAGDQSAATEIASEINSLRDSMRAALINGDLYTNTPATMTQLQTENKNGLSRSHRETHDVVLLQLSRSC